MDRDHKTGWMEGFPPPEDKIISVERGNHYQWPQLRWTFSNIQQLAPTKCIWRGAEAAWPLELQDASLDRLSIDCDDGRKLSWREALEVTDTDGLAVLHRGELVHETYLGYCGPHTIHLMMSCAKSFAGVLAEMLIDEGVLDEHALIPQYLPELHGTAWEDASLRQVMDMLVGMEFHEDYTDPGSEVWRYLRAGGMVAGEPGDGEPAHLAAYLETVRKQGEHGQAFAYREPNINVLTFVIQRVTNRDLKDLVSERLWQHIGAEHDGLYMVDPVGTCTTAGCSLRDFLRFGELMRTGSKGGGDAGAVDTAIIDKLVAGGDPALFARAQYPDGIMDGWSYKSQWWIRHKENGNAALARGAHGQLLYIDPLNELVIARFGSSQVSRGYINDPVLMPMIDAITKGSGKPATSNAGLQ
jgi:CubicO group peptidase (beta-lactamase class C family)